PDGDVGTVVLLAILDVQIGDLVVVLFDESHGVVTSGGEVADVEVDTVVFAVGHQGGVAFQRGGLVVVVGGVVAVIARGGLVFVGDGRDALGHGEGSAGGDAPDAEALGHRETVLDVLILHAVLHVVAEEGEIDPSVVELLGDGFPGAGVGGGAPLGEFFHRG